MSDRKPSGKNRKFTKTLKMIENQKKKTLNYLKKNFSIMGIGGKMHY
jgi:hypothetical protein